MATVKILTLDEGINFINSMDFSFVENELLSDYFQEEIDLMIGYYKMYLILLLKLEFKAKEKKQLYANHEVVKIWSIHASGKLNVSDLISEQYKSFCEKLFGKIIMPQPLSFTPDDTIKKITYRMLYRNFHTSYASMKKKLKDIADKYTN